MVERSFEDILNVSIDTNETKVYNAVAANSFQTIGPNGEIIFDSTQQIIPGFIVDTASFALTASTAPAYLPLVGGTITGNLTVNGTTTLNNVIAVTSSYSSGSTIFGDALIDTHKFTGSVFITGSSLIWNNSAVIASNVTSSMNVASASQALTASYFNGSVTSASYAATASKIIIVNEATSPATYYPIFANGTSGPVALGADASTYTYQPSTNILTVTSSLALGVSASSINSSTSETYDGSNISSINWGTRRLQDSSGNASLSWEDRILANNASTTTVDWQAGVLNDSTGTISIDWERRRLKDTLDNISADYEDRRLIANDGATISLDWTTPGSTVISGGLNISGSLTLNNSNISTAWTSYTPVWTAASVNPVINNGTIEGWYKLVGKTCFVRGNIAMGSTTTFGSGEWYISMPFTASHADAILMTANLLDNTTAWYNAVVNGARAGFNYKAPLQYQAVGGTANDVNATQPFTWANSDRFIWNGSFEIA
jgi:hypothetical protein